MGTSQKSTTYDDKFHQYNMATRLLSTADHPQTIHMYLGSAWRTVYHFQTYEVAKTSIMSSTLQKEVSRAKYQRVAAAKPIRTIGIDFFMNAPHAVGYNQPPHNIGPPPNHLTH
jgi:hypothetical protein